jgi:hypothetical protein
MKRLPGAVITAIVLCGVLVPRADAATKFANAVVAPAVTTGEPKVFIDNRTRTPTIYVVAPESSSQLWRSTDGGRTFAEMAPTQGGGGDADVAVDAMGTVYVADLLDAAGNFTLPVSTSYDRGRSFARIVKAAPYQGSLDREWIASNGAGHVVATARDGSGTVFSWVSTDSARSFGDANDLATNVTAQGPVIAGPRHVYYTIYGDGAGIEYARSADGANWTTGTIAFGHFAALFPVIAADSASDLYAVWSEASIPFFTGPVFFSKSTDGGGTWSDPAVVSPARPDAFGSTPSAIFPWVVAGSKGRVAVSYAVARQVAGPDGGADLGGPQTTWDLVVMQTNNALASRPAWSSSVIAPRFHTGSICPDGIGCLGPQQFGLLNVPTPFDRRDLDFAGAAVDAGGRVYVAYNRDRPLLSGDLNDIVSSQTDMLLARQTSGPRLR